MENETKLWAIETLTKCERELSNIRSKEHDAPIDTSRIARVEGYLSSVRDALARS